MKNLVKILVVVFITTLISKSFAQAQDKIYKKNKEVIECIIKEVGSDEIKYDTPDPEVPEDVLLSISIDKILKIEFANGKQMTFQDNFSDPENYADQHRNAIKISFLEPLMGSTSISYERSLKPGKSIEGTIGIIGLGWDSNDYEGTGAYAGFGIKFLSKPDHYYRKMRYAHILKGFYMKPEIIFSSYRAIPDEYGSYNYQTTGSQKEVSVIAAAFILNLGKQWIFDDAFLLDLFVGFGYGHKSRDDVRQYSMYIGDQTPFTMKFGLKIGFLY